MKTTLDQLVIYQLFPRNHTEEGTLSAIVDDLDRIRDLGADILYLLPINPIGLDGRKGNLGSPYAIKDYFAVNPDLGTMDDFKRLADEVHRRGMCLMLDMVFNHTAVDSVLTKEHPEFYDLDDEGRRHNKAGGWSDVVDLNTHDPKVQDYLVSVIRFWADQGADGFRFDVASLVDVNVFRRIRKEISKPLFILAETVEPSFVHYLRRRDIYCCTDEELAPFVDCEYNYDSFPDLRRYLNGETDTLAPYRKSLRKELRLKPVSPVKITAVENHDQPRIASLVQDKRALRNILAWSILNKGPAFIYAGEEYGLTHRPDLFEKDPIDLSDKDEGLCAFVRDLIRIKKLPRFSHYEDYRLSPAGKDVLAFSVKSRNECCLFLFDLSPEARPFLLAKGSYFDLISGRSLEIEKGPLMVSEPLLLVGKRPQKAS